MKHARLLLVDDDELVLATFGRALRSAGFDVGLAGSGEEALEIAGNEPPDLAILDLRMPGMSGIETATAMRELGVAVMFLTAYTEQELGNEVIEGGALGLLVKPIDLASAIPAIEAALERAAEER